MAAGVMGDPSRTAQWTGLAGAVATVVVVSVGLAWVADGRLDTGTTAGLVAVVLNAITLAVALSLYIRWRITRVPAIAWVTVAFVAVAVDHLTLGSASMLIPDRIAARPGWALTVDTVFSAAIVNLVVVRRRRPPRLDPALIGVVLGLAVGAVRLPLLFTEPLLPHTPVLLGATAIVTVLLHAALMVALLHLGLPVSLPRAVVTVVVLLAAGGIAAVPVNAWHGSGPAGTWADAGVALLVAGTAIAMFRATIAESTRAVAGLRHRIDEVEAGLAADRERLHEINATVAGIATASRLMHDHHHFAPGRKEKLDELLTAEIERLERLVEGRQAPLRSLPVDETVERLVLAHRAMGRDVRWTPCGLVVRAHGDDLAEILTTLLNNAAEHAPGSPVWISARGLDDAVEITVADHGPGVGHEMAERIFDRGARGQLSHGQGIGLYVARRLTEQLGGSLFVIPAQAGSRRGAVFVLTLPNTRSLRDTATATAS